MYIVSLSKPNLVIFVPEKKFCYLGVDPASPVTELLFVPAHGQLRMQADMIAVQIC